MKFLVVGNWKMNPQSLSEANRLFDSVGAEAEKNKNVQAIICPPFIYIPVLAGLSAFAKGYDGLAFGSQDCFWEEKGAFTGEISAAMLKDSGCEYVILGHSERRRYFGETDETLNKKIKAALLAGLKPILCVGENDEQRKNGKTEDVLRNQLENDLKGVSGPNPQVPSSKFQVPVVAYEPVWAIGTGNACEPKPALSAVLFIRKILTRLFNRQNPENFQILYGGSVNAKNAVGYVKTGGINGFLLGGGSLDPKEFGEIMKTAGNLKSAGFEL